jgi:hypothetical protein
MPNSVRRLGQKQLRGPVKSLKEGLKPLKNSDFTKSESDPFLEKYEVLSLLVGESLMLGR